MHHELLKRFYPLKKLYCYFLLGILLKALDVVVLEQSSLVLRFSKMFLVDLKSLHNYWNVLHLFDFAYFVWEMFCRIFWSIFRSQVLF